MDEEKKHRYLHDYLKGLPKVKSRNDFDQRLLSRLRNVESEKFSSPSLKKLTGKKFSIADILRPSLVPAIGLTIILLVFVVYYINISQKEGSIKQITQNEEPATTKSSEDGKQNKSSDSFITKNESAPPQGNNLSNRENQIKSPESTVSKDFGVTPSITDEEREHYYDFRLSEPKPEEKKLDELKSGTEDIPKVDDKKEVPVMKKSGDYKFKESEKRSNEEDNVSTNGDMNKSIKALEQNITNDTSFGADSTKITKGRKNHKKNILANDTLKIPAQKPVEKENDSKK